LIGKRHPASPGPAGGVKTRNMNDIASPGSPVVAVPSYQDACLPVGRDREFQIRSWEL